jgi:hypothetical protein
VEVLFDRVAGLDVGKASLTVCLRTPGPLGRRSETRTFKTTTGSLRVMRDWLIASGVTIAAMESTSTYWKAPFYCLGEVMEVAAQRRTHEGSAGPQDRREGCRVDRPSCSSMGYSASPSCHRRRSGICGCSPATGCS